MANKSEEPDDSSDEQLVEGLDIVASSGNMKNINSSARYEARVLFMIATLLKLQKRSSLSKNRIQDMLHQLSPQIIDIILDFRWNEMPVDIKHRFLIVCCYLAKFDIGVPELLRLVKNPWKNNALNPNALKEINAEQAEEFLNGETANIIKMRLRFLVENRCQRMALRYSKYVFNCLRSKKYSTQILDKDRDSIINMHIKLLHESGHLREMVGLVKSFSVDEGIELVKRFTDQRNNEIKELMIQILLAHLILQPFSKTKNQFVWLVEALCDLFQSDKNEQLTAAVKKLCMICESSDHVAEFAKTISRKVEGLTRFVMELYVRVLTTEANSLDNAKSVLKDIKAVHAISEKISTIFSLMADKVDNSIARREFLINAFTVYPTREMYETIETVALNLLWDLAIKECPKHRAGTGPVLCPQCGHFVTSTTVSNVSCRDSEASGILSSEMIDLPDELRDDLNVVLSSTRVPGLSWERDWTFLKGDLLEYLNRYKDLTLDVRLNFVDIDYSLFKNWPAQPDNNEYFGIEKGYEKFIEDSDNSNESTESASSFETCPTVNTPRDIDHNVQNRVDEVSARDYRTISASSVEYVVDPTYFIPNTTYFMPSTVLGSTDKISNTVKHVINDSNNLDYIPRTTIDRSRSESSNIRHDQSVTSNTSEKHSSDPNVLRSLRAFRPLLKRSPEVTKDDYGPVLKMIRSDESSSNRSGTDVYKSLSSKSPKDELPCNKKFTREAFDLSKGNDSGCENLNESFLNKVTAKTNQRKKVSRKRKLFGDHTDDINTNLEDWKKNFQSLTSLEDVRPAPQEPVVQVIQISGQRDKQQETPASAPASADVSPHIQRVGQPTTAPKESSPTSSASADTSVTIPQSQPSVIVSTSPASGISIIKNEYVRPPFSQLPLGCSPPAPKHVAIAINAAKAANLFPTPQPSASRAVPATTSPHLVLNPQLLRSISDDGQKQVQLLLSGKTFRLAAVPNVTPNARVRTDSELKPVKVTAPIVYQTTTTATTTSAPRSVYEANYAKFIESGSRPEQPKTAESADSPALPKFQQAFGKTLKQTVITSVAGASASTGVVASTAGAVVSTAGTAAVSSTAGEVADTRTSTAKVSAPPARVPFPLVQRVAASGVVTGTVVTGGVVTGGVVTGGVVTGSVVTGGVVTGGVVTGSVVTGGVVPGSVVTGSVVPASRVVTQLLYRPRVVVSSAPARIPAEVDQTVSSSTLEQLREFDKVMEKVKERSTVQPSSGRDEDSSGTSGPDTPPRHVFPVVLVDTASTSIHETNDSTSPGPSASSMSNSTKTITVKTTTATSAVAAKSPKSSKSMKSSNGNPTKSSPVPKLQQKPQEDEGTAQRIYSILAEYAEQLRNSPDLNNKPAPRRRSNPPTNPSQNTKRKKTSGAKKCGPASAEASPGGVDDNRATGSEDGSCGAPSTSTRDAQSLGSADDTPVETTPETRPTRQLILTDAASAGHRNVIIADSAVGEALAQVGKMTNAAAVLMPGNYILPVSMVKTGQQITIVGGNKILAVKPIKIPTVSGQPTVQSLATAQVVLPTISSNQSSSVVTRTPIKNDQRFSRITTTSEVITGTDERRRFVVGDESHTVVAVSKDNEDKEGRSDSERGALESEPVNGSTSSENGPMLSDTCVVNSDDVSHNGNETEDESGVSKNVKKNWSTRDENSLRHSPGMQFGGDVVQACARSVDSSPKKRFVTGLVSDMKADRNRPSASHGVQILLAQRKQAALEREMRLQKSLSEECEDLGVDEPSASDLFPEAHLLFDSNHSPSFDGLSNGPVSDDDIDDRYAEARIIENERPSHDGDDYESPRASDFLDTGVQSDDEDAETEYFFGEKRTLKNGDAAVDGCAESVGGEDLAPESPDSASASDRSPSFCRAGSPVVTYSRRAPTRSTSRARADSDASSLEESTTRARSTPSPSLSDGEPTRRSSQRGHVKRGCPCCVGSPKPAQRRRSSSLKKLRPLAKSPAKKIS